MRKLNLNLEKFLNDCSVSYFYHLQPGCLPAIVVPYTQQRFSGSSFDKAISFFVLQFVCCKRNHLPLFKFDTGVNMLLTLLDLRIAREAQHSLFTNGEYSLHQHIAAVA